MKYENKKTNKIVSAFLLTEENVDKVELWPPLLMNAARIYGYNSISLRFDRGIEIKKHYGDVVAYADYYVFYDKYGEIDAMQKDVFCKEYELVEELSDVQFKKEYSILYEEV